MKTPIQYDIGSKLRDVRERKGLTLRQVAEMAGVSESLVSQIERNRVSPSMDTMLSLAYELGIDVEYLFRDYRLERQVTIVPAEERSKRTFNGVTYSRLSAIPADSEKHAIDAVLLEIGVGAQSANDKYGHPGRELGIILEGEAELEHGSKTHRLKEGDSVSFASSTPHVLRNTGDTTLKAMWVITPPRFVF